MLPKSSLRTALFVVLSVLHLGSLTHDAHADIFFQDEFAYANGDLVGMGGWYNPTTVGSLSVVSGELTTPDLSGEYVAEHLFSRSGCEAESYYVEFDAFASTPNNALTIRNPVNGSAIASWGYLDSVATGTGWSFNGEQSSALGEVRLQVIVDPQAGTVVGQAFDLASNSLLFTSSTQTVSVSQIQDASAVYIYGDSRLVASDARWDNLLIATDANCVPEPSSLWIVACGVVSAFAVRRKR